MYWVRGIEIGKDFLNIRQKLIFFSDGLRLGFLSLFQCLDDFPLQVCEVCGFFMFFTEESEEKHS